MAISIGNNIAALNAQRHMSESGSKLELSLARLSSGQRITRASDDAAGLAIADSLQTSSRVLNQAIRNVNDGISVINIASGALGALSNITIRQKELAEQAAQGIYTSTQREAIEAENKALYKEYNRIIESTQFNGRSLLDGSQSDLRIQAGYGIDGGIGFTLSDELNRTVGIGSFGDSLLMPQISVVGAGDVNNDGNLDYINVACNSIYISTNDGSGNFTQTENSGLPGGSVYSSGHGLADVNNDGFLDVLVQQESGGNMELAIVRNNGDGTFDTSAPNTILLGVGSAATNLKIVDFNADGNVDLLWRDPGTNDIKYSLGVGDGNFTAENILLAGGNHTFLTDDVNADGYDDVVVSSDDLSTRVFLGNSTDTPALSAEISTNQNISLISDFNNDGYQDLLMTDSTLYYGNSSGTFTTQGVFSEEMPVAYTDINDDSLKDLIFAVGTMEIGIRMGQEDGGYDSTITSTAASYLNSFFADFNGDDVVDFLAYGGSETYLYMQNTTATTSAKRYNLSTRDGALEAISGFGIQLEKITNQIGSLGASQSRLIVASNTLTTSKENYITAGSRITDVDIASEAADLTRLKILQDAGNAVLAQANQLPKLVLKLLS